MLITIFERKIKINLIITLLILFAFSFIDNSKLPYAVGYYLYNVIIKPIFWLTIAGIIIFRLPKARQAGKIKYQGQFLLWAFNCALLQISFLIIAGLITGLGKSPYDHSVAGIVINTISVGSVLVSLEVIRSYVINHMTRKENYKLFIMITLLMIIPQLRISHILQIHDWVSISMWICEEFGPMFCQGLLATYLCFLGGPMPAIIYMSIQTGFHWFSPILPDLPWLLFGLIGIMVPLFQMTYISGLHLKMSKVIKVYKSPKESFLGWVVTCIFTISMLWFVVGVFPIYPSVIATGSMEPEIYPGDIILVEKITELDQIRALKVGDIIQFKRQDMMICHRIDRIIEEKGVLTFVTKGDNNPRADIRPVKVEHIKGSVVKVVPKVGWPSLVLKLAGNHSLEPAQL